MEFSGDVVPAVDLDRFLQALFAVLNASPNGRPPIFYFAHVLWRHRDTQVLAVPPSRSADPNKRRIPVEYIFEDDLPKIFVDPIQLQEVFINLISNAIEAMENNPREPRVTIRSAVVEDREIAIEVTDNGPGVHDLEKIFDAFVTTKEKGMGIGLAVSRSIVEAHDGELWAQNNRDFGAKIVLRIPLPKSDNGL